MRGTGPAGRTSNVQMRLLGTVLLCLLVVGCDDEAATPTSMTATTLTSTTSTTSTTPTTAAGVDAVDCGEDFSALDQVGPPSVARRCFLDANRAGKPAQIVVNDVRGSLLLLSNADRTIDVVADGAPSSTCAGLAPDDRQVFRLASCDPPLDD